MASLLDNRRPPAFCPGCCHERVVGALDQALGLQSLAGHQVALVSDIGCSGLFDTFFRTHALHGLHGRALTYATGLKLARPELHVVVTMGDGGLGIGGAHLLAASRRNLDMTLLVLNNFNFGMTGGQCSVTTPSSAEVSSGFLNRLEPPLDVCRVAAAAGAPHVRRLSAYDRDLPAQIAAALRFAGFAVLDIRGVCPGRYTRRNRLTPEQIASEIAGLPALAELEAANAREEYGRQYRRMAAAAAPPARPVTVAARQSFALARRRETVILGSAGQRVVTAGELLGLAAMSAGLHATQKSDYDITVLRGPSITEVILSPEPVGFTGLEQPDAVLALSQEAVERRRPLFAQLRPEAQVVAAGSVSLPASAARVQRVDFGALGVRAADIALAGLAWLARGGVLLTTAMLEQALDERFDGERLARARAVVHRMGELP